MISLGFPTYDYGVWGARMTTLGADEIDGRNEEGVHTSYYTARDWRLDANFAYPILSYLGLGVTYKQYWRNLASYSQSGNGLDLGFLAHPYSTTSNTDFRVGVMAENLVAPHTGFLNDGSTWPRIFRVGTSLGFLEPITAFPLELLGTVEMDFLTGTTSRLRAGFEVTYHNAVALRFGLDGGKPTTGLGVITDYLNLDYSVGFSDLAPTHSISISYNFDYTVEKMRANRTRANNLISEGREYYELGNYQEALEKFKQARTLESFDPSIIRLERKSELEALFKAGKANFMAEKYEQAVRNFSDAREIDQNDRRVSGYLELAEQRLQIAREVAARKSKALELIGLAKNSRNSGNLRKALSQLKEALSLDPEVSNGSELLAQVKRDIAREEQQKRNPPQVTSEIEFPDEAHAQYRRALEYMQSGSYISAERELQGLASRFPNYPGIAVSLSNTYTYLATEAFTQGNLTDSRSLLKKALYYDGSNGRARRLLERVEIELRQLQENK
jgi:tetratricopeptide (TPR) repeat protein